VSNRWMMIVVIQLMALLPVSTASTQPSPPDGLSISKAALTGPVARQWVFTRFDVFMGPGDHCQQGDALRFLASGNVEIERCQNEKVTIRSVPWTLRPNGPLDPILDFDGKSYLLIFSDRGPKHYMTLRQRGASPTEKTVDQEYLLSGG